MGGKKVGVAGSKSVECLTGDVRFNVADPILASVASGGPIGFYMILMDSHNDSLKDPLKRRGYSFESILPAALIGST